jgi:2-polyprenyl-6-methoxyphenol hydroxylase-like FAD-dependent oxidoreductase
MTEHVHHPPTSGDDTDTVLVVGAGSVGLAAAGELVRQGARVRLVDALPAPTTESRAIVVHPRTQEHLDAMGALDRVAARAQEITGVEWHVGNDTRPRVQLTTAHVDSRHPRILDLSQVDTEAVLREVAAERGVAVENGVRLDDLVQDDDGVTVTLTSAAGTEQRRYGWVVGADGGHSTVRRAVGTRIEGVFVGQDSILADVDVDTQLSATTLRMFMHPTGLGAMFPLPDGRARFTLNVDPPPPGSAPTVEEVQRLVDERMGGLWRIGKAHWLTYFQVHHGQVPQYRHGRVLLAGDAAHIHSPLGGQGMNTGIQDAVNLAWKLALVSTGRADQTLLDTYHAERHPVAAAVVAATTRGTDVMASSGLEGHLRNLGLLMAGHLPTVRRRVMTAMTETAVTYRKDARADRSCAAVGDHAPDVRGLRTAGGTFTWIGDLLRRPGHLLLATGADATAVERLRAALGDLGAVVPVVGSAEDAPADALVDRTGEVARRYGLGAHGYALIRPDGYLAATSRTPDDRALVAYLDGLRGA